MTFRMPCLDISVDTRLRIETKPRRLNEQENTPHANDDCVLTLAGCWKHDDHQFMYSKIDLLENDSYAIATKIMATKSWTNLLSIVQQTSSIGCLGVVGCGHKFSGVPLLYTFMTTGFKCPICRYGGNVEVDITAAAPRELCPHVWTSMCTIANVVRKRDVLEKINEQRVMAVQMSRQAISVIYQTMPWVILFVLYKETHPTMASTPYAQIPIKMSVNGGSVVDESSSTPGNINLSAGSIIYMYVCKDVCM